MGWVRDILGGVADPAARYGESREATKQVEAATSAVTEQTRITATAMAVSEGQSTFRPALMHTLRRLVRWYYRQSFVYGVLIPAAIVMRYFGIEPDAGGWGVIAADVEWFLAWWAALGTGLVALTTFCYAPTAVARTAEKWRGVAAGGAGIPAQQFDDERRGVIGAIRDRLPGFGRTREAAPPEATQAPLERRDSPITRLDGVVVPDRLQGAHSAPQTSGFVFGRRSRNVLDDARPELVAVHERALQISELDFTCYESIRTAEKQRENIENGVSWTFDSRHLERPLAGAIDHVPLVDGKACWDWWAFEKTTAALKQAAAELGIECTHGVDWKGKKRDGPHTELLRSRYPMGSTVT